MQRNSIIQQLDVLALEKHVNCHVEQQRSKLSKDILVCGKLLINLMNEKSTGPLLLLICGLIKFS